MLIIGGGPAGLSAAIELGKLGVRTLLVDDKDRLGGKLVLQTHKFFGSVEDSYAGTRGFEIGNILAAEIAKHPSVEVWLNTTAVAVFCGPGRRRRARRPLHHRHSRRSSWWPPAPAKKCSPSPATRCPAFTGPGPSRPWSTATW
ncbi:MAG: FAD-dependent oxidoreductase [Desulfobacterales bacterium]|nr:FAD-dependent oxidoreductase [Desulfobacterales bacterium]